MFNEILYRPLFNALVFLYKYVTFEDLGVAIILLTIIIRFLLLPLFYKSAKSQFLLQKLQPEIAKIQAEHKNSKEKQVQKTLELYKQHKVNPFSGFLMLFIQLPILIVLYRLFLQGFTPETLKNLYSFISPPEHISNSFLGLIDLGAKSMIIAVLAAILQGLQSWLSLPKIKKDEALPPQAKIGRQMIFIGPIITLLILRSLPAAVGIYWLTTSVFSIVQQLFISKAIEKTKN